MSRDPTRAIAPAWVYRVAKNLAVDALRRRKTAQALETATLPPAALEMPFADQVAVRQVFMTLPWMDRAVLWLFYYERWTTVDLAAMLGVRPGTVRGRLYRARERFLHEWEGGPIRRSSAPHALRTSRKEAGHEP